MPAHDYHPLRLRSVLPGSAHLVTLEARAAARTLRAPVAADVDAYISEIRHLLDERAHQRGERPGADLLGRTALDEALRISKALQWARSGSRVVRVSSAGPPGMPARGTLRVGGIQLPAACVYVAFADAFPTPDPGVRIAGVYLGEGGSLESLAAGWVEHVWALAIAVPRSGEALGSATASWHASIGTADPGRLVSEALGRPVAGGQCNASASSAQFGHAVNPPPEWHETLSEAVECALQAAALASVASVVPRTRALPSDGPLEDPAEAAVVEPALETARSGVPRIGNARSGDPRSFADLVFGPASPRARNRWLVEREPLPPAGGPEAHRDPRRAPPRSDDASRRTVSGYDRVEHERVYHRGTPKQFSKWIAAHPVNGGRPKDVVTAIVVDRLDPQHRPSPAPN